ncbi:MAG: hypothetical protein G3W58_22985, partial [Pantoea ananatis]|nr:hypothetical protein [Pantoea ananatis]
DTGGGGSTNPPDTGGGGSTNPPDTGGGGSTNPPDTGGGGSTNPPAEPPKRPILGFQVSAGVAPTKVGDDFQLKVRLALGSLTVTITDDIGVADGDLRFEYSSTGIKVAVWSVVNARSMKLLILGVGGATLTVTHVPTGVKSTLKITISLL